MTRFNTESTQIYTSLLTLQAHMSQVAKERTGDADIRVQFTLFIWEDPDLQLKLCGKYSSAKVEVKGKHLGDMLEEALRRLGFEDRQKNLQIEHIVEAEAVPVAPATGEYESQEEVLEEQGQEPVDLPTSHNEDEIPF